MAGNYDWSQTGFLGGVLSAKADQQADVEFTQRKNLNALKLRDLTNQIQEYESTAKYRQKKRDLELDVAELKVKDAKLTLKKMNREINQTRLDRLAEIAGLVEDDGDYQQFVGNIPQEVRGMYDIPKSWDEGGSEFVQEFYNSRLMDLDTRRSMMEERQKSANKLKQTQAKDIGKLPTKTLIDGEYLALTINPMTANLDEPALGGLASEIVTRARSLQQQDPTLTYNDAKEISRGAVLRDSLIQDPADPGVKIPLLGTFGDEPAKWRIKTAEDIAAGGETPGVKTTKELSSTEQDALDWANNNPNDPRAAKIKAKLGIE